jgi:hypothetical protein
MYKIIKHSIEEQHYDHPELALAAMQANGCYTGTMMTKSMAMYSEGQSAVKLRMEARSYFSQFLWRMRSYIISEIDSASDLAVTTANLTKNIDDIGELIKPYYGEDAGNLLNKMIRDIVITATDVVKTAKVSGDLGPLTAKVVDQIKMLAKFLNGANPMYWPEQAIIDIFTKTALAWASEAVARQKKDHITEQAADDTAYKLLLGDGTDAANGFANIMASGIIYQYPNKFP